MTSLFVIKCFGYDRVNRLRAVLTEEIQLSIYIESVNLKKRDVGINPIGPTNFPGGKCLVS